MYSPLVILRMRQDCVFRGDLTAVRWCNRSEKQVEELVSFSTLGWLGGRHPGQFVYVQRTTERGQSSIQRPMWSFEVEKRKTKRAERSRSHTQTKASQRKPQCDYSQQLRRNFPISATSPQHEHPLRETPSEIVSKNESALDQHRE